MKLDILIYKHISSHCEVSQKCSFNALFPYPMPNEKKDYEPPNQKNGNLEIKPFSSECEGCLFVLFKWEITFTLIRPMYNVERHEYPKFCTIMFIKRTKMPDGLNLESEKFVLFSLFKWVCEMFVCTLSVFFLPLHLTSSPFNLSCLFFI